MSILDRDNKGVDAALLHADPNAMGVIWDYQDIPSNQPPLLFAIEACNVYAVKALLQKGANVFAANADNTPAIYAAVAMGHDQIVKLLLEAEPKLVHVTSRGSSLLDSAIFRFTSYSVIEDGQYESKEFQDAIANYYLQRTNTLPMDLLATKYNGSLDIVRLILHYAPGSINSVNSRGFTPLDVVQNPKNYIGEFCDDNGQDTIRCLTSKNDINDHILIFQVTLSDRDFENPFQMSVHYDFTELRKLFLKVKSTLTDGSQLQEQLKTVQERLNDVNTKTNKLYQPKVQRSQWEQWIQYPGHENLEKFYHTVETKFQNILLSFKAVDGGQIDPKEGKVGAIRGIVGGLADVVSIAPLVGAAAEKFIKWGIDKSLAKVDEKRELNTAKHVGQISWRDVEKEGPILARKLTVAFAQSLLALPTPEEAKKQRGSLKQGIDKVKGAILKDEFMPPAEEVALLAMTWVVELLYEDHQIAERVKKEGLSQVFFAKIVGQEPPSHIKAFWQAVTNKLGGGISSKSGVTWHPEDMFTLTGIRTETDEYFVHQNSKPDLYGWRLMPSVKEVEEIKLRRVEAPTNLPPTYLSTLTISQFNRTNVLPFNPSSEEHSLHLPSPDINVNANDVSPTFAHQNGNGMSSPPLTPRFMSTTHNNDNSYSGDTNGRSRPRCQQQTFAPPQPKTNKTSVTQV